MRLRSIDKLDVDTAWKRVLATIRAEDLSDRLPFELINRLVNAGFRGLLQQTPEYSPRAPIVYFAPKESRTLRPLVSLGPADLLIYQALVDQATYALQQVLPPEHVVFAYRITGAREDKAIENRSWSDFQNRARTGLEGGYSHILETDLAGFFLHIRPSVIVQRLLSIGVDEAVCLDLGDLLAHFAVDGIQGLPQGLAPSSALSNLALMPLDRALEPQWDEFFRWSDDLRYLASSFSQGYEAQERIERLVYGEGFSIGGGKTYIRKAGTAIARMANLQTSLDDIRDTKLRTALAKAGPYEDIDPSGLVEQADAAAAEAFYEELVSPIRIRRWSKDPLFRRKLRFILRVLGDIGVSLAIKDSVELLFRYPDQVAPVSRNLQRLARREPSSVRTIVGTLMNRRSLYLNEYVRFGLSIAAAPLAADGPSRELSEAFAEVARDEGANTLLRRRASLTAVALSAPGSDVATELWDRWQRIPDPELSRLYLVAGASGHADRDRHFAAWRGESRLITAAVDYLSANSLDLSKI